jgi:hypothetical protein
MLQTEDGRLPESRTHLIYRVQYPQSTAHVRNLPVEYGVLGTGAEKPGASR